MPVHCTINQCKELLCRVVYLLLCFSHSSRPLSSAQLVCFLISDVTLQWILYVLCLINNPWLRSLLAIVRQKECIYGPWGSTLGYIIVNMTHSFLCVVLYPRLDMHWSMFLSTALQSKSHPKFKVAAAIVFSYVHREHTVCHTVSDHKKCY